MLLLFSFLWQFPFSSPISATFGEWRKERFHVGVDLPGYKKNFSPILPGKILWKKENWHRKGKIPFGGGKMLLFYHPKEKKISGYMHLSSLKPQGKFYGKTGNSGYSYGAHLHFFLLSTQEFPWKYENPLLYLPHKDVFSPHIEKILYKEGNVLVSMWDYISNKKYRLGVYAIEIYQKEKLLKKILFSFLSLEDGRWKVGGKYPFYEVYQGKFYLLSSSLEKKPTWIKTSGIKDTPIKKSLP